MKYTRHNLDKIELLFEEIGYDVRYEKGNFQSGYCLLESKKVVVINKFFETEGRIQTLADILTTIEVDESSLSAKSAKCLRDLRAGALESEES
jgi:hypothetical protein